MQKQQPKWVWGVLVSAALMNCVGAAGKDGKDGAPGVNAPEPTSSIAWVSPNRLAKGRTHTVTVLGSGTRFSATTTLDFGAGITVLETKLLSDVTLEATVNVADTATLGSRTLTVTTGAQTLSGTNLISVLENVKGTGFEGTLSQGSEGAIKIENTAPSFFAPTSDNNGNWVVGNATFKTESTSLQVATNALWMHNQSALLAYSASPFATKETVEILYSDKRKETVELEFAPSAAVALTETTPVEVALSKADAFKVFSFTTEANRGLTLKVNLATDSKLKPRLRAYVQGKAIPVAAAESLSLVVPAVSSSRLIKIVLSDVSDVLTETPEKLTVELTQSPTPVLGTCASGACTVKWTFTPPMAIPETPEASLIKTFLFDSATPCNIAEATGTWEMTHTYPSDVRFGFIFPDGTAATSATDVFKPTERETPAGTQTKGTATKTTAPWLGKSAVGLWTLDIRDVFEEDTGTLESFELKITCAASN